MFSHPLFYGKKEKKLSYKERIMKLKGKSCIIGMDSIDEVKK